MTKFRDLVSNLDNTDDELTLFIADGDELRPDVDIVLLNEEVDVPPGLKYVLEVEIAKDVLRVWSAWRNGREPSINDACAAIAYYAERDAYQPVGP